MGLQGVESWANFAATKSYTLALGDGLAYALEPQGINVLTVLPGPTLAEGSLGMGAQPDKGPMKFKPPDGVVGARLPRQEVDGRSGSHEPADDRPHEHVPVPLSEDEALDEDDGRDGDDWRCHLLGADRRGDPPAPRASALKVR